MPVTATENKIPILSLRTLSYVLTLLVFLFVSTISGLISLDLKDLTDLARKTRTILIPQALEQHEKALQARQLLLLANIIASNPDRQQRAHALQQASKASKQLLASTPSDLRVRLFKINADIDDLARTSDSFHQQQRELETQLRQADYILASLENIIMGAQTTLEQQAYRVSRTGESPQKLAVLIQYLLYTNKLQNTLMHMRSRLSISLSVGNQNELYAQAQYFDGYAALASRLQEQLAEILPQREAFQSAYAEYADLSYLIEIQYTALQQQQQMQSLLQVINTATNRIAGEISDTALEIAGTGADDIVANAESSMITALWAFSILLVLFIGIGLAVRLEIVKPTIMAAQALHSLTREPGDSIPPLGKSDLREIADINAGVIRLRDTIQDNRDALDRVTVLAQMQNYFVSSVSHEIRTPLTSLQGYASVIVQDFQQHFMPLAAEDSKLTRKAQRIADGLHTIDTESRRLSDLINDVLDIAKIESGKIEWHDDQIDIPALITRTHRAIAGEFLLKKQVRYRQDIGDLPAPVVADADRLQQVLLNLLKNAIKFTEKGEVGIRIWQDADYTYFSVFDTGVGIAEEDQVKIFEKFQQAKPHRQLRDKPKGTGLGLAISRQIVEHYGGHFTITSSVGVGSTFTFLLPIRGHNAES